MSTLDLKRDGAVRIITLNRPDKYNAINDDLAKELTVALQIANGDSRIRALVLTGAGKAFCSGQDLGVAGLLPENGTPPDLSTVIDRNYMPLVRALTQLNKPILAYVNGVAAGAGANLAYLCDLRMASPKASFVQSFSNIGLIPDTGGTWSLPRLVGLTKAMELAMFASKVTASEALALGMVNWVAESEDAGLEATVAHAKTLAERPTVALGRIRQLLNQSQDATLNDMLFAERAAQKACGETADYAEGVAAFLEKRSPNYQGR